MRIWHLICLLGLMAFSLTATAQRALYKPQIHEISLVGGLGMYNNAYEGLYTTGAPYAFFPQAGLQYTYHYSISDGFRFGLDYRNVATQREIGTGGSGLFEPVNYRGAFFNAGYERKYHAGASQLYGGADLMLYAGEVVGPAVLQTFNLEGSVSTFAWGGRALAGYRLFLSPYVSVALEGNLFYLSHNYSTNVIEEIDNTLPVFPETEIGVMAKVRISYHFKKMKKRCTCRALNHR